jgi:hypothetical protein
VARYVGRADVELPATNHGGHEGLNYEEHEEHEGLNHEEYEEHEENQLMSFFVSFFLRVLRG